MKAMHVLFDIGKLPKMSDDEFQKKIEEFVNGVPAFQGLRKKYFILNQEEQKLGGFYVMDEGADLDSYFNSAYWAGAVKLLGEPEIKKYDVVGTVLTEDRRVLVG